MIGGVSNGADRIHQVHRQGSLRAEAANVLQANARIWLMPHDSSEETVADCPRALAAAPNNENESGSKDRRALRQSQCSSEELPSPSPVGIGLALGIVVTSIRVFF
jgi:hypothetical protein